MRAIVLFTLFCGLATPLSAQEALGPEAFERFTTGKTLRYATPDGTYGIEQYLSGRRVIWAFLGEPCKFGTWYPDSDRICFVYDDATDPHCWRFFATPGGLMAEHFSGPGQSSADLTPLVAVDQSPEALTCPGPGV